MSVRIADSGCACVDNQEKQRRAWQIQSNKQSNLNAYIAESINGIRVTQSFVREDVNTDIFNRLNMESKNHG